MAMLRFGITVSRNKEVKFVFIVIAMVIAAACHRSDGAESIKLTAHQAGAAVSAPTPQDKDLAKKAVGTVVVVKNIYGSPTVVISVTHFAGDHNNAMCEFRISEGQEVTAENSNMIECGPLLSPEMVDVEITGNANDLEVFQQKDKQTNSYSLQRIGTGRWIVKKVVFTRTQDNTETGETDVIRETADLGKGQVPIQVGQFDYASIKDRLVESIVR